MLQDAAEKRRRQEAARQPQKEQAVTTGSGFAPPREAGISYGSTQPASRAQNFPSGTAPPAPLHFMT